MIKAILFDLDDTLITTHTDDFIAAYFQSLMDFGVRSLQVDDLGQRVGQSYFKVASSFEPQQTLSERFYREFSASFQSPPNDLQKLFNGFYQAEFKALESFIEARPVSLELIEWLHNEGYRVVVATNPALPEAAIFQRMRWGGLDPDDPRIELITTLENMAFDKSSPAYYAELLLRLGLLPHEVIMVGDDQERDIRPANEIGMHTFWIGAKSLGDFFQAVRTGALDKLSELLPRPYESYLYHVGVFPAAIRSEIRGHSAEVLECSPGKKEWSARDILCHLYEHDILQDRVFLEKVLAEDNPFLSGNTDPWANAESYASLPIDAAFNRFADYRVEMVSWLKTLPETVRERPARLAIFGPSSFGEIIRFASQHDRGHLRQLKEAIAYAVTICGPEDIV